MSSDIALFENRITVAHVNCATVPTVTVVDIMWLKELLTNET